MTNWWFAVPFFFAAPIGFLIGYLISKGALLKLIGWFDSRGLRANQK
jgi:hypothetical protein